MTAATAWETHKRACRRCQRQWKHWEDGDMTCETGVDLFLAAKHGEDNELVLFEVDR